MGHIIKLTRSNKIISILSNQQGCLYVGLDHRGVIDLATNCGALFQNLFILKQTQGVTSIIQAISEELKFDRNPHQPNKQSTEENKDYSFSRCLRLKWRDLDFDIFTISPVGFLLAKLQQKTLIRQRPCFQLECEAINLNVPIFANTSFTIGSHIMDSVVVPELGIKPNHIKINIFDSISNIQMTAMTGGLDKKFLADYWQIKLHPCEFLFTIKNYGVN